MVFRLGRDSRRFGSTVRRNGLAALCIASFLAGCNSSTDLPTGGAPAPDRASGVAVDLAQWPFGSLEKRYRPAQAQDSGGPAFLRSRAAEGFDMPAAWEERLRRAAGERSLDQLSVVNDLVNTVPYVAAASTVWKSPRLFLAEGGGCNCYAIAKYVLLRRMGYSEQDLRITVVRRNNSARAHSVLMVRLGPGKFEKFILDNVNVHVRTALYTSDYHPLASMNENGVWLHDATAIDVARYLADPPVSER